MPTTLLATKLRVPPAPQQHVSRASLVREMEELIVSCKLVHVAAPAGYGKTTFLAEWSSRSRLPVGWLAVGEEDNDPELFFRSLIAAWECAEPRVGESTVRILTDASAPDLETVLSAIVDAGSSLSGHMAIILDDAHVIGDEDIWRGLTFLVDHMPPRLHLVLASRGTLPLPLARYRARGELRELEAAELAFDSSETRQFLEGMACQQLPPGDVDRLQHQLEGWAAGLQLVGLRLRKAGKVDQPLVVSGRHRFIADYLREDVLANLAPEVQLFMLRTSILERMTGSLCDAVIQGQESQATLEMLERESLFLVSLDDERDWYRYHRLFGDVLHENLMRQTPADVPGLHSRAARWFLDHNVSDSAFRHALAAKNRDLVLEIIDRYLNTLVITGQFRVIKHWFDAIPGDWHETHPMLGLAEAALLLMSGSLDLASRRVDGVEQRLVSMGASDRGGHFARVSAVRCFVACFHGDIANAEAYARTAFEGLESDEVEFRSGVFHALGDTYRSHGRWEDAQEAYLRVLDVQQRLVGSYRAPHVYGALADLEVMRGRLELAAEYWRRAQVAIRATGNQGAIPLPVIGWVYVRMGELEYERNALDGARAHAVRGVEIADLGGDVRSRIAGSILTARLALADGDPDGAEAALTQAGPLVDDATFPDWSARFARVRVELWLVQGKLRSAIRWTEAVLGDGDPGDGLDPEITAMAAARVLCVAGDDVSLRRADTLLRKVIEAAIEDGRRGNHLEAEAMRGMVQLRQGREAEAMESLGVALRIGEAEGYTRTFVDLGPVMARLLKVAHSRQLMPAYVAGLLDVFGISPEFRTDDAWTLPEHLSAREVEVLRLLAAGLTNREIADALFISSETIKKHTARIYGKLGVGNRTEAAARGLELKLIDQP